MKISTFLGAAAFTIMATAMPTPTDSAPRSCGISLPSSYQQISEDAPTQAFQQNRYFQASQASDGVSNIDSLVLFTDIPPGSYGCQLGAEFTFEYPIQSSGSTQLNVYALPNNIQPTDTYLTYFPSGKRAIPTGAFLFGTTTLNGTKVMINSAAGIGGLYMTYNC